MDVYIYIYIIYPFSVTRALLGPYSRAIPIASLLSPVHGSIRACCSSEGIVHVFVNICMCNTWSRHRCLVVDSPAPPVNHAIVKTKKNGLVCRRSTNRTH